MFSQRPKASKMAWCKSSSVWSPRIWMVREITGFFLANFSVIGPLSRKTSRV